MPKPKHKKNLGISPERLTELRRATLIASAGASTRLEGSKMSDKDVEQVVSIVFGQKQGYQTK
ncbi:MAG: hypothetical protein A2754_04195 [Candidatus Magasanikbacteria bacterium RIFCSPHIGHO2_01_FULL_47_8]|uniref:Uncharacterized protein n=1 Tax=Candidatus Magasanikbacteria bacterium RIFCSPHIGHO2_01_FULL_47_8 TaxID=1798673 RepID=A0A1F6MCM1_9BACT|nr:MAG: hypothetical protein A2754_04195 [Candidatus Magasanikbacteria bacterium RIFCSPHIGHO2_01_FULL_47_8]